MVVAYGLGDLDNTVTRLEIADTVAGAFAVVLLAAIGLPPVRASLSPLAEIETTAAAIADGDLSRRIDHPSGKTEAGGWPSRWTPCSPRLSPRTRRAPAARNRPSAGGQDAAVRRRRQPRLRTPLTSVRGLAEYGLQQGDPRAARTSYCGS